MKIFKVNSIYDGNGRKPKSPATPNGYKDSVEMAEVPPSWDCYGIDCGGSNLVVVDLDVKNGSDGVKSFREKFNGDYFNTYSVRTPNGGLHLYFTTDSHDVGNRTGILPGVDIRGNGGYIIGAGSRIALDKENKTFGTYEVVDPNLKMMAIPTPLYTFLTKGMGGVSTKVDNYTPEQILGFAIKDSGPGTHNEKAFIMCARMRDAGIEYNEVKKYLGMYVRSIVHSASGYNWAEAVATLNSVFKKPAKKQKEDEMHLLKRYNAHVLHHTKICELKGRYYHVDGDMVVDTTSPLSKERRFEEFTTHLDTFDKQLSYNVLRKAFSLCIYPSVDTNVDNDVVEMKNGNYNCKTGKLESRTSPVFKISPFNYISNSKLPDSLSEFLKYNFAEPEYNAMLRAMAYSLTYKVSEKAFFILTGPSNSGKTQISNLISEISGGGTVLSRNLFTESGRFQKVRLLGAKVALIPELESSGHLDSTIIKSLTGDDFITAEFKGSDPFTLKPTHKLWITSNNDANVLLDGSDLALWNRVHEFQFKQADKINPKLYADWLAHGSEIVSYLLDFGFACGFTLEKTESQLEACKDALYDECNYIHTFFKESLSYDPNGKYTYCIDNTTMKNRYEMYCELNKIKHFKHFQKIKSIAKNSYKCVLKCIRVGEKIVRITQIPCAFPKSNVIEGY